MGDPRTLLSKDKSSFPLKTRFVRVFFWLLPCACSNEATHRRYWVFSVKSGAATSWATAAGGFALRLRKLARNASRNRSALIRSLSSASFANAILLTARCRCAARCQMASRHASRLTLSPSLRIARHLRYCCCSSVVERVIGNDEVGSSILPSSTMAFRPHITTPRLLHFAKTHRRNSIGWGDRWGICPPHRLAMGRGTARRVVEGPLNVASPSVRPTACHLPIASRWGGINTGRLPPLPVRLRRPTLCP